MNTPVLLIGFNRPKHLEAVISALENIAIKNLYVFCDGPRNKNDTNLVDQVRKVVNSFENKMSIVKFYSEENYGCKYGVSGAISWFFKYEEAGIILEDDCIPSKDFIFFSSEMLDLYKDSKEIMAINGSNFQFGNTYGDGSYYLSKCFHAWGWATWKRAWKKNDIDLQTWKESLVDNYLGQQLQFRSEVKYWKKIFNLTHQNKIDTWDFSWQYTIWKEKGFVITPNMNLVTNIGHDLNATHTKDCDSVFANIAHQNLGEIEHPSKLVHFSKADQRIFDENYGGKYIRFPKSLIYIPMRIYKFIKRKLF